MAVPSSAAPVSAPASFASALPIADLFGFLRRWRRPILLITLVAAIVSSLVSLTMPNIYPATTTFYATNLETSDPVQLASGQRNVVLLPEAADQDRVLNIGRSQPVADHIIAKYHLARHYKNDTTNSPEALQATREEFQDRLDIQVTDRDAVQLSFLDTDRDLAATIANDLVITIDSVTQQLTRPNRARVLNLFETKYRALDRVYTTTRDSLMALRRHTGIYGMEREDRYLAKAIVETQTALRAARAGGGGNATALQAALDGLLYQRPGSNTLTLEAFEANRYRVSRLQQEMDGFLTGAVAARSAYEIARASLTGRVSNIYLLQPAFPQARKIRPVRSVIVLSSTLAAFVLSTLAALLIELLGRPGGALGGLSEPGGLTAGTPTRPRTAADPERISA